MTLGGGESTQTNCVNIPPPPSLSSAPPPQGGGKRLLSHMQVEPKSLKKARSLRKNMTEEETILWTELRQFRKRHNYAFRRQAPIGPFVVDFLCRKAMLIIEVDGEHHGQGSQWDHDQERDAWLVSQGYRVIRFWNADIRQDVGAVVEAIYEKLMSEAVT